MRGLKRKRMIVGFVKAQNNTCIKGTEREKNNQLEQQQMQMGKFHLAIQRFKTEKKQKKMGFNGKSVEKIEMK